MKQHLHDIGTRTAASAAGLVRVSRGLVERVRCVAFRDRRRAGASLLAVILVVLLVFSPTSHATVVYRNAASGNNLTGNTSVSVAMPSGTVADDVMVAVISARGGTGTTITPPAGGGWNLINSATSTTVLKSSAYYKVAVTGETGPYSFGISPTAKATGVIVSYSGVDTASPINAQNVLAYSASLTLTAPTISPSVTNTMLVGMFSTAYGSTVTAGSSMTLRGQDAGTGGNANTRTTTGVQDIIQAGTGASGAKNMTVGGTAAVNIGHLIALTPAPVVSQVGYRWFSNSTTAGQVGSTLAAQDTAASAPAAGQPFRLRMLLGVAGAQLPTSAAFKLQYKYIASGTCDATGTFADVSTTSPIKWYDNTGVTAPYTPLSSSGNDPFRTGVTVVSETYNEANNFVASTAAVPAGQDGMWDFALTMGSNADPAGKYCLRATTSTGSTFTTYSAVPTISALMPTSRVQGQDYRFYDNADSTTPGTTLAGINAAATIGSTGGEFRMRGGVSGIVGFKQISGVNNHACSIGLSDSKAYCWGGDYVGQLGDNIGLADQYTPVAVDTTGVLSGKTILSISAGFAHTCAIASDNLAYCWGSDGLYGSLGDDVTIASQPTPVAVDTTGVLSGKTILSISAGTDNTCVIASDNKAYCWGGDPYGQLGNNVSLTSSPTPVAVDTTGVLSGKTMLSISVGSTHVCAVASDNKAYCWGNDTTYGRLGDSVSLTSQPTPVAVDTTGVLSGKTILSISAGMDHTCAVASDNNAYCWGKDIDGQLGNDVDLSAKPTPVAVDTTGVLSGKTILSISAGPGHTCAVASDNLAYCWGGGSSGKLGDTGVTNQPTPVAVYASGALSGKSVQSLATGYNYSCAVTSDNKAYCWGSDYNGQLGDDVVSANQLAPVAVSTSSVLSGKTILSMSAGANHTCVIASDNKAYCWGDDSYGQLGNNTAVSSQPLPVAVDTTGVLSGKTILSITTGDYHTCVIASDNKAYCWGRDGNGQLGDSASLTTQPLPVAVDTTGVLSGKTILSITTGGAHTCAVANDNNAYCWGDDSVGQLGNDASFTQQPTPVAVLTSGVLSGKTISSISGGGIHTCAIASDNKVYCWGGDGSGQLGDNVSLTQLPTPAAVDTTGVLSGKTISAIATGAYHSCVIANDNNAYCWGGDGSGRLGNDAAIANQPTPVAVYTAGVLSGKTILSISLGFSHTCAIASDNLAYCWGDDGTGQLGDNVTIAGQTTPVAVSTSGVLAGKVITAIAIGDSHSCAVDSSNNAFCWGYDGIFGQLGNDATLLNQPTPVPVERRYGRIPPTGIGVYQLSLGLQFAQKTAGSCSAQTGFADVTGSSVIAYKDNASVSNASSISGISTDPIPSEFRALQTYHDAVGAVANPSAIVSGLTGLWDFALKDNSAPASTTYCLRLAGSDGAALGSYAYFPEITTAASSGGGPTLDQQLRGGQSVVTGTKAPFIW